MSNTFGGMLPDWHPLVAKFRAWVTIDDVTDSQQLWTGSGTILALIVQEPTGSAGAAFTLYDGTTDGAQRIGPWTLAANESIDNTYPTHGLPFQSGVFLDVTSGEVDGSVLIGSLVPWDLRHIPWGGE